MTEGNGKQPHEMSGLGTFTIGCVIGALLWCGAHLDSEQFFLWLVGALACAFVIIIVAALEGKFGDGWDFEDEDEEE